MIRHFNFLTNSVLRVSFFTSTWLLAQTSSSAFTTVRLWNIWIPYRPPNSTNFNIVLQVATLVTAYFQSPFSLLLIPHIFISMGLIFLFVATI